MLFFPLRLVFCWLSLVYLRLFLQLSNVNRKNIYAFSRKRNRKLCKTFSCFFFFLLIISLFWQLNGDFLQNGPERKTTKAEKETKWKKQRICTREAENKSFKSLNCTLIYDCESFYVAFDFYVYARAYMLLVLLLMVLFFTDRISLSLLSCSRWKSVLFNRKLQDIT